MAAGRAARENSRLTAELVCTTISRESDFPPTAGGKAFVWARRAGGVQAMESGDKGTSLYSFLLENSVSWCLLMHGVHKCTCRTGRDNHILLDPRS